MVGLAHPGGSGPSQATFNALGLPFQCDYQPVTKVLANNSYSLATGHRLIHTSLLVAHSTLLSAEDALQTSEPSAHPFTSLNTLALLSHTAITDCSTLMRMPHMMDG